MPHSTLPFPPALLAFALAASTAAADVQYISQLRTIGATARRSGNLIPSSQDIRAVAPDFSVWSETVEDSDSWTDVFGMRTCYGLATQTSELTPTFISWTGRVGGTDDNVDSLSGIGMGLSQLRVVFSVEEPTPFTISGSSTIPFGSVWEGTVRLSEVGGPVIYSAGFALNPISGQGVLDPGEYELFCSIREGRIGTGFGSAFNDHTVLLTLPAPAAATILPFLALVARRRRV